MSRPAEKCTIRRPRNGLRLGLNLSWSHGRRPGDTLGAECLKRSSLEPKVQSSGMYIDGEWVHSKTEEKIEVVTQRLSVLLAGSLGRTARKSRTRRRLRGMRRRNGKARLRTRATPSC